MRFPLHLRTDRPRVAHRTTIAMIAFLALGSVSTASASLTPEQLQQIQGDYTVAVYPKPFGFLVKGGVLHLKVGGVEAPGDAAPLIEGAEGRFVVSEGHPNAFQFVLEGTAVRFRFWSGSQSFDGVRVGAPVSSAPQSKPIRAVDPRTRRDLLAARPGAEAALAQPGATAAERLALARLLYESGEFETARRVVAPLEALADAPDAAIELAARLDYLSGEYSAAERGFDRLLAMRASDPGRAALALVDKLFVYYQQDRFDAISALPFPKGATLPLLSVARGFSRPPYRIEWHGGRRETSVAFAAVDPLPVFPLTVDGTTLNVIFDTGADQLILDTEVAHKLGVTIVDEAVGSFAGGLTAKVGFGRVGNMRIGDVTLHDVPVQVLPAERFTFDSKHRVGGIVGTALLRHFLGTVDYQNARLVLRERSSQASAALRRELGPKRAVEVPFVLDATHLLFARGRINGVDGMTMFVDSGLASEAALVAPAQTLAVLDIPLPETKITAADVGGGAGAFAEGFFAVDAVALGPLEQRDLRGEYGALTADSYWARGFIQDALLSHRFLRRYASWTLDFDARLFTFVP